MIEELDMNLLLQEAVVFLVEQATYTQIVTHNLRDKPDMFCRI